MINRYQQNQLYRPVCRPALPQDTQDVMELTSKIWEGEDYVPYVWDEWLADYAGFLAVCEYGGKVIGLGKLTLLTGDQWWLEGLRVHPGYEGRGIASHLNDYILNFWDEKGNGIVRLATASKREKVKHLSEKRGFHLRSECTNYSAAALPGDIDHFRKLTAGAVSAIAGYLEQTTSPAFGKGLVDIGWQWAAPTEQLLRESIEKGAVWGWVHPEYGQGYLLCREDFEDEGALYIGQLLCGLEATYSFLGDIRHLAAAKGYKKVAWIAQLDTELNIILEETGFQREWDMTLLIYEKAHPSLLLGELGV